MTGQELITFIDENIPLNEKGAPWSLSKHQRDVQALMFSRHYTVRLWSEIKKSGKTFWAACIAIGEAITNPDAEIICVANDEEQAMSRVFATVCQLIKYNSQLTASATVQAAVVKFTNGSTIKYVSSDYKGQAGGRQRLTIFDELWAFSLERMTRLFEEMTPPSTEAGAYVLIVSYAGFQGESELLENLYKRGLAGKRIHKTLEVYRAEGLCMFWSHVPRMPWQLGAEGRKYYAEQKRILRPGTFARLHRNEWVSAESTFITQAMWDAIVDPSWSPILSGGNLFGGVDIGVKHDSTGIVLVSWDDDGRKLKVAHHRQWKPTKGQPVNLDDVEAHILELARLHGVRFYADPSQCLGMIQRLTQAGILIEEFPQTQNNTIKMGEALFTTVTDKNLIAYPSSELREHVTNAVGRETGSGVRMVKGTASRKIDLAIALSMGLVGALQNPGVVDLSDLWAGGDRTMALGPESGFSNDPVGAFHGDRSSSVGDHYRDQNDDSFDDSMTIRHGPKYRDHDW